MPTSEARRMAQSKQLKGRQQLASPLEQIRHVPWLLWP